MICLHNISTLLLSIANYPDEKLYIEINKCILKKNERRDLYRDNVKIEKVKIEINGNILYKEGNNLVILFHIEISKTGRLTGPGMLT